MSKTFETNAQKALSLAEGLKKNYSDVKGLGVSEASLDSLKEEALKAIEMTREVDSMQEAISKRRAEANAQLLKVKDEAMKLRKMIKSSFPQEKWAKYGLMDKR